MQLQNEMSGLSTAQTKLKGGDSMRSTWGEVVDFFAGFTTCARAII